MLDDAHICYRYVRRPFGGTRRRYALVDHTNPTWVAEQADNRYGTFSLFGRA